MVLSELGWVFWGVLCVLDLTWFGRIKVAILIKQVSGNLKLARRVLVVSTQIKGESCRVVTKTGVCSNNYNTNVPNFTIHPR